MVRFNKETLIKLICKTSAFDFDYCHDKDGRLSIVFSDPYYGGTYHMIVHGENHLHPESIFIVKEDVVPRYDDGPIMTFNDGASLEDAFEIFWNAKSAEVTYQMLEGIKTITVYTKTMNELTIDKNCMPIMFHEVMYNWSSWNGNEPIDEARQTRQCITLDKALEDVKNKINVIIKSTDLTYSKTNGGLAGLLKSDVLMTGIPFHYGPEYGGDEVFTMVWPSRSIPAGMSKRTSGLKVSYPNSAMAIINRKKFYSKFHLKNYERLAAESSNAITVNPDKMADAIIDLVTGLKIK